MVSCSSWSPNEQNYGLSYGNKNSWLTQQLLTSGLSNQSRKAVVNGKERPFLKVFLRYCACENGTTDGRVNGQTQGRRENAASSDAAQAKLWRYSRVSADGNKDDSTAWRQLEARRWRTQSSGCKNANLKHANGLDVILKVADKSFVQQNMRLAACPPSGSFFERDPKAA